MRNSTVLVYKIEKIVGLLYTEVVNPIKPSNNRVENSRRDEDSIKVGDQVLWASWVERKIPLWKHHRKCF